MGEIRSLTHFRYSTVPGYFLQDDPETDPSDFDYAKAGFGLIDQTYDTDAEFDPHGEKSQWERFRYKLDSLNAKAADNTEFKLLFVGRHGQGYHNVAEAYYGTMAWNCYWSSLDGNEMYSWDDSLLTAQGIEEAEVARDTWTAQMAKGIPLPEAYYTSPLTRCLETAKVTFSGILTTSKPFVPTVKEVGAPLSLTPRDSLVPKANDPSKLLRETIGIHRCDRRSSRSTIRKTYPTYRIERGLAETDPLWVPDLRESDSARTVRLRELLDDIFLHDHNTYISLTAHGGAIQSILEAVGHRPFKPPPGGVIPLLIRAETLEGTRPHESTEPWQPAPTCSVNPTAAA